MSQEMNLKAIEHRAWQSVFQDGLIDLWLGWLLLWWGVMYIVSQTDLSTAAMTTINMSGYIPSVIALVLCKRYITRPRVGRVQFGPMRVRRLVWMGLIAFILVNGAFCLTVIAVTKGESLLGDTLSPFVPPLMLGAFFMLLYGVPALLLQHHRLFLVGLLFALPQIVRKACQEFWDLDPGGFAGRALGAAILITLGLITFIRFLREHPVPDLSEGEADGERE